MRRTRRGLTGMLGLALLLAASLAAAQTQPTGETSHEGKLHVVGGGRGGEPQLTEERGKRWLLTGTLREELLRFSGHRLRVWASEGLKQPNTPTLEVSRYELLATGGGRKPLVGVLRQDAERALQLERKEGTLQLKVGSAAFAERLAQRVGCTIWVVGELEGTTLKAYKFGWIRCKPKTIPTGKETTP